MSKNIKATVAAAALLTIGMPLLSTSVAFADPGDLPAGCTRVPGTGAYPPPTCTTLFTAPVVDTGGGPVTAPVSAPVLGITPGAPVVTPVVKPVVVPQVSDPAPVVSRPSAGHLTFTGADIIPLTVGGAALLLVGGSFVVLARRRRPVAL